MANQITNERIAELRKLLEAWTEHPSESNWPINKVSVSDLSSMLERIDRAEAEIQISRRERCVLMGIVEHIPDEQLNTIPEGKLLASLRMMDDADKAKDYRTAFDQVIEERDIFRSLAASATRTLTSQVRTAVVEAMHDLELKITMKLASAKGSSVALLWNQGERVRAIAKVEAFEDVILAIRSMIYKYQ